MIDKLLLNNQIISNKKKIQQARTQTINKLVQKIRKLKMLKEKYPKNVKVTENLDKTPKIMRVVKKIKTVDIIRRILTLSKKPSAVLTNGQSQPDEIAVALLASNKFLANIVNTLRTLLHLDDNNPNWKNEIMEESGRKKKLLKNDQRKKSIKVGKAAKLNAIRKNPWKEENLHNENADKLVENDDIAPASGWKVEDVGKELATMRTKEATAKVTTMKAIKQPKEGTISIEGDKLDDRETRLPNMFQKPVKTVDSFFFTETGDNYLSTVVIDRVQPEAPDDGLIRRERRDKTMRPSHRHNNNSNKRQSVQHGRVDKRHNFTASKLAEPQQTDEKLHPSWAAKQKQKPIITQFKGQKITFDDDANNSFRKFSDNNSQKLSGKTSSTVNVKSEDNIHPSWAAKQKLKPTITEFQGKKITFDE